MIEVKLTDRYEYARARYARYSDAELLEISIDANNSKITHQLSIPEAEKLIKDLQEWIHEIKD